MSPKGVNDSVTFKFCCARSCRWALEDFGKGLERGVKAEVWQGTVRGGLGEAFSRHGVTGVPLPLLYSPEPEGTILFYVWGFCMGFYLRSYFFFKSRY